jgi:hypothetical protein
MDLVEDEDKKKARVTSAGAVEEADVLNAGLRGRSHEQQ